MQGLFGFFVQFKFFFKSFTILIIYLRQFNCITLAGLGTHCVEQIALKPTEIHLPLAVLLPFPCLLNSGIKDFASTCLADSLFDIELTCITQVGLRLAILSLPYQDSRHEPHIWHIQVIKAWKHILYCLLLISKPCVQNKIFSSKSKKKLV